MRVLVTADTIGGVWSHTTELARALIEQSVDVAIATLGRKASDEQHREAAAVANLGVFESEYRLPWMEEPWNDVAAARTWLSSLVHDVAPDVVHLSEPVFATSGWSVPTVAVAHSCVLSWWDAVHGEPAPPNWAQYQDEMRAGLAAASVVVTPSRFMALAVRRHYATLDARVIPNGRDPAQFHPGPKEPLVFAAGRLWDRAKNFPALDQAAAGLAWPVNVAGDFASPDRHTTEALRNVGQLGRLSSSAMASWQARASIYALPARYEPFGLSVLEAALAECALVLGDVPSLRELWDGVAVFVDPDDPQMLHDALATMIADSQLRHTLAMRARRRARAMTPNRMASAYVTTYIEAITKRQQEAACAS